ncbi:AimR family lysis-lysogeny pheromone receptor [Bacillus sp. 03113]|uniref:AimR family lysis-lysogeny pheromone receptor n=1 Tax=Bacillus sp. 03113 TaxID=2578211 RepID=UPI001144E202|nr:AimR family lysis-lysogeny pheromone receptor [Bacillus sp. 03113]
MKVIKKEIFDYISDNDIVEKEFAVKIGCKPSQLSDAKLGKNLNFRVLLKAVIVMNGKNYKKKLEDWCLRLDYAEGIKHAFEYASLTKNEKLLGKMLDKHKNSFGVVKECCIVYGLLYKHIRYEFPETELKDRADAIKGIKNKTLLLLIEIIKVIGLYYKKKYLRMLEDLETIEDSIKKLSDKRELFIKECYFIRCSEAYAPALFQLNSLDSLRQHAKRLINTNISATLTAAGYYYMGMSYIVEDKERALQNLQLNYEILKGRHHRSATHALSCLNFARSYHYETLIAGEEDETIKVYNKIKLNKKITDEEKDIIKNSQSSIPFKKYYLSLEESSVENLSESVAIFASDKKLFYANLVLQDIKKLNPNMLVIDGLLKINFYQKGENQYEKNCYHCFSDFRDFNLICC